jgi:hypothetical protein
MTLTKKSKPTMSLFAIKETMKTNQLHAKDLPNGLMN